MPIPNNTIPHGSVFVKEKEADRRGVSPLGADFGPVGNKDFFRLGRTGKP
jgi:hypothetical protein